jgi:hypothetical protein
MDKALSWLKVEYWYHVFIVLGVAGTVAALTVDLKGIANSHALLLSMGAFFVGMGEWINHPLQTGIVPPNVYLGGGGIITGHPRRNSMLGIAFDIIGLVFVGIALYKIAVAA